MNFLTDAYLMVEISVQSIEIDCHCHSGLAGYCDVNLTAGIPDMSGNNAALVCVDDQKHSGV